MSETKEEYATQRRVALPTDTQVVAARKAADVLLKASKMLGSGRLYLSIAEGSFEYLWLVDGLREWFGYSIKGETMWLCNDIDRLASLMTHSLRLELQARTGKRIMELVSDE